MCSIRMGWRRRYRSGGVVRLGMVRLGVFVMFAGVGSLVLSTHNVYIIKFYTSD